MTEGSAAEHRDRFRTPFRTVVCYCTRCCVRDEIRAGNDHAGAHDDKTALHDDLNSISSSLTPTPDTQLVRDLDDQVSLCDRVVFGDQHSLDLSGNGGGNDGFHLPDISTEIPRDEFIGTRLTFMADRTQSGSPALTSWPSLTRTSMTTPDCRVRSRAALRRH